jgi:hypothetical protein
MSSICTSPGGGVPSPPPTPSSAMSMGMPSGGVIGISWLTRLDLLLGQPDPEVQPERAGDLLAKNSPRLRRDPSDDLADEPAVGDGVVAVLGAGLPQRARCRRAPRDGVPVEHLLVGEAGLGVDQPRLVAQQPRHRDLLLALGRELRPVLRHRRVQVQLAALGEQVGARAVAPLVEENTICRVRSS